MLEVFILLVITAKVFHGSCFCLFIYLFIFYGYVLLLCLDAFIWFGPMTFQLSKKKNHLGTKVNVRKNKIKIVKNKLLDLR